MGYTPSLVKSLTVKYSPLKKKEELVQEDTVSVSEDGGLVSPTIAEVDTTVIGQVPQEFGGDEVEQYTPKKVEEGRGHKISGICRPT